ncbi:MAG: HAD hydrolase-like protein [Candidatus Aminicenantes bacterium]|nr:HAD hydrolase-like protein [Candidatus Aminicenantes bacterium]NIM83730.1 HAD hydrolase-like protein [Candidatus Aminicenantes bacterium]NIN23190.1 HAD hydrolase-like protein [Candidatus Aminicenantes bacterium]NIN46884.1 HAD hydrolase-like protein [Candidatus Aminicenantes bacterium]NIN89806.1 HAD hydrolase-like protein [Candidatus Aminicenantes bacterium]
MNIIFDLDDTLYLEKLYIFQGFWEVSKYLQQHIPFQAVRLYLDLVNLLKSSSRRVFDDLKEKWKFKIEPTELVTVYRNAPRRLILLPDVEDGCKILKENRHHLILITNGDSETQWKKVNAMDLEKIFDLVLVADDYGKEYWKPSAKLMEKILENFGPVEQNYLVVGNGTDDLEFAQNAGLEFIYIKRPRQLKIINGYQGRTIENLYELNALLRTNRT